MFTIKILVVCFEGNRATLINRHKAFTVLYNAECDSLQPRSVTSLIAFAEKTEAMERQLAVQTQPILPRKVVDIEMVEKQNRQYLLDNKESYNKLIDEIKQRTPAKITPSPPAATPPPAKAPSSPTETAPSPIETTPPQTEATPPATEATPLPTEATAPTTGLSLPAETAEDTDDDEVEILENAPKPVKNIIEVTLDEDEVPVTPTASKSSSSTPSSSSRKSTSSSSSDQSTKSSDSPTTSSTSSSSKKRKRARESTPAHQPSSSTLSSTPSGRTKRLKEREDLFESERKRSLRKRVNGQPLTDDIDYCFS